MTYEQLEAIKVQSARRNQLAELRAGLGDNLFVEFLVDFLAAHDVDWFPLADARVARHQADPDRKSAFNKDLPYTGRS